MECALDLSKRYTYADYLTWIDEKACEVYYAPVDVRLPKNGETANDKIYTVVQPDICCLRPVKT